MKNILLSSIYVGTYKKYNSGSLGGKWMKLADYTTKRAFLAACKELHKDESDPEYMFQDWEHVPDSFITESSISDETWHVINSLKKFAPDRADDFAAWCEDQGAEQDYNALKEFLGFKNKADRKSDRPTATPTDGLQKSRDELVQIINSVYQLDSDRRYYLGKTSNAAYLLGKLILFEKPSIETRFCFSDENDAAMKMYSEFGKKSKTAEEYFVRNNLNRCDSIKLLAYFETDKDGEKKYPYMYKKLYLYKDNKYHDIYKVAAMSPGDLEQYKTWYPGSDFIELNSDQEKEYQKLLLNEKATFEYRLNQYLKRYGLEKVHTWTYWANR